MRFHYQATNKDGKPQEGLIEADSERTAILRLQSHGLQVTSLEDKDAGLNASLTLFQRIKQKELVQFSRELSTLVEGKVSLVEALRSLGRQQHNEKFKDVISDLAKNVEGGMSFSGALAQHPKVFSNFFTNLVKSAEVSGTLETTLLYLADYEEKRFETKARLKGALTYPAFIISAALIVGVLMMVFVVPQITQIIVDSGQQLPLPTRILIWTSDFLRERWYIAGGIFAVVVGGLAYFMRLEQGKMLFDRLYLQLPVFGNLFRKFYLQRLAENLATLLKGGVSIITALEVVRGVIGNTVYAELMDEARMKIQGGKNLSEILRGSEYVPSTFTEMLKVGERSGNMEKILQKLASFYDKEVNRAIDAMTQLIEPMLMLLLGAGVAILISAILLPIYQISTQF